MLNYCHELTEVARELSKKLLHINLTTSRRLKTAGNEILRKMATGIKPRLTIFVCKSH